MTILASDTFTRADGALGSAYTQMNALNALQIVSNNVEPALISGTLSGAFRNDVTWPADQWSQVTVQALTTINDGVLAVCRAQTGANSYYALQAKGPLGASTPLLIKVVVAGTPTVLTSTSATVAAGDILYLQIVGTTLLAKLNGATLAALTITDANFATGKAGLASFASSGGVIADSKLNGWSGGDFTSAVIAPVFFTRQNFFVNDLGSF